MSSRRIRRAVFSCIALLAILMVTFAPSVTGLLSASGGWPWEQVCSTTVAAASAPTGDDAPAPPHVFEHCPYCALHADLAPPPDPLLADAGVALAFRTYPLAFTRAPRATAAWTTAQPRAPPFLA